MTTLFETKLRYEKMTEEGMMKKVTEAFLVDALSFTEAEARIIEEMSPYISGEFSVVAIKRTKITEIFWTANADKWWSVKAEFISVDEKGVEKKSPSLMLVQADDSESAARRFEQGMNGTMSDYNIIGINETAYLDVFAEHPEEA